MTDTIIDALRADADAYGDAYVVSNDPVHLILALILERAGMWRMEPDPQFASLKEGERYMRSLEAAYIAHQIEEMFPASTLPTRS